MFHFKKIKLHQFFSHPRRAAVTDKTTLFVIDNG